MPAPAPDSPEISLALALHTWEWATLAVTLAVAGLTWWLGARVRTWSRERLPRAGRWVDVALLLVVFIVEGSALWRRWSVLSPRLAPMGPDANNFLSSALAFELGDPSLFAADRYPGYPWLVSLLADGAATLPQTGVLLSLGVSLAATVAVYLVGRQLAGRAAGVVGAVLMLRQPLMQDVPRTFTSYPLTAALDAGVLAAGLSVLRTGSVPACLALGGLAALAIASDMKQFPFVLGVVGVCTLGALSDRGRPWRGRLGSVAAMGLPLLIPQLLVQRAGIPLLTLEAMVRQTPVRLRDPSLLDHVETGFALGRPDAALTLIPSFWRVITGVAPIQDGLDPRFLGALPMVAPDTSLLWGVALLAAIPLVLLRSPMGRGRWGAAALLLLFALASSSTARHHYTHRYALAPAMVTPVALASAGQLLLGGPAVLAGGLTAALLGPPFSASITYAERQNPQSDAWIGPEQSIELDLLEWTQEELPAGVTVFDFSTRAPQPILAIAFDYVRCPNSPTLCSQEMAKVQGPIAAIVHGREFVSSQLPEGPRRPLGDRKGRMGEAIGDCWQRIRPLGPQAGLYVWGCERQPVGWPEVRQREGEGARRAPLLGEKPGLKPAPHRP